MNKKMSALLILALVMVLQPSVAQTNQIQTNHPMLSQQKGNIWSKLNRAYLQPKFQKAGQLSVLNEAEIYSWSGEGWFTNGKVNYQYQDGNLVQVIGSVFDGEGYTIGDRTTYSYLDGYLAQEIYEEADMETNELQNVERIGYGYTDFNGTKHLTGMLYSDWINGWIVSGKDDFTYTDGIISGGIYYTTDNFNFIEEEKFTVTSSNDTTVITYFVKSENEWLSTEREIYAGFSPQQLFNYYMNLDHSLYDMIFSYPLIVLELPDVLIQEHLDSTWENTERISSNKFYELGNDMLTKLHKNFEYWNEVEWAAEERIEYYFNTDSRIDSALVKFNFEPPALQTYMKESFLHDSFGNLVTIVTQVDSGEGLQEYMKTELRWSNSEPTSNDEDPLAAKGFKLAPAYPNPFNPATNIQYTIEQAGEVSIKVYDLLGREVAELIDGRQAAGSYIIKFNAEGLSSGIYYVRMSAGNFTATRSISLVK